MSTRSDSVLDFRETLRQELARRAEGHDKIYATSKQIARWIGSSPRRVGSHLSYLQDHDDQLELGRWGKATWHISLNTPSADLEPVDEELGETTVGWTEGEGYHAHTPRAVGRYLDRTAYIKFVEDSGSVYAIGIDEAAEEHCYRVGDGARTTLHGPVIRLLEAEDGDTLRWLPDDDRVRIEVVES